MSTNAQSITSALSLVTAMLSSATQISDMVAKATAEGRSTLTDDEWQQVIAADDSSRQLLQSTIDHANQVAGG